MKSSNTMNNSSSSSSSTTTSIANNITNTIMNTDNITSSQMSNSNTSRYKSYLIEKLLNESITPSLPSSSSLFKPSGDTLFQQQANNTITTITNTTTTATAMNTNNAANNTNHVNNGSSGLNDSREDLTSETGTYVIDEPVSSLRHSQSNQNNNYNIAAIANNTNNLKQSTNTIDLMSARAAIGKLVFLV